MPTLAQMRNRMLGVHERTLACLRDGKSVGWPGMTVSDMRAVRRALRTLRRWEAIDEAGRITDIGRQLLSTKE